ncbi:MAG: ACT domain-containing protein [Clostridia bacterium]|nr:ACT domain-containing protein [Clostridia bacterium]
MVLQILPYDLTICKIPNTSELKLEKDIYFIGKTDEELSLVCKTEDTPNHTLAREDGWRGFRIQSELDFSLTGILSKISTVLAESKIGIFAVSTYNTDYVLVKKKSLVAAIDALTKAGYDVADKF